MSSVTNTTPQNGDSTETLLKKILLLLSTSGAAVWGQITGTVTEQLDLVDYIASVATGGITPTAGVDCTSNPNYPARNANDIFFITGAGKIGGASGVSVEVGDLVFCVTTNAGGTQAAVGSNFTILQVNIPGLTTIGLSLATLANPSAITFPRFNADNTTSALTAAQLLAAIGAAPTNLQGGPCDIQLAASDETTALTAGTGKVTFRMPYAMTLTAVRVSLTTAQSTGSTFTVDVMQGGASVLGTKATIANTSKTSVGGTPATITTSALTDDAEMRIDVTQIGDGTAKGLKVTLIGTRA